MRPRDDGEARWEDLTEEQRLAEYKVDLPSKYQRMLKDHTTGVERFEREDIGGFGLRVVSKRWRTTSAGSGYARFGMPRGQFIGEYRGEWLCASLEAEEAEALVEEIPEEERTYLFTAWHPHEEDRSLFVLDAENKNKSNLTRYVNHSCQPNCEFVVVEIPGTSVRAHPSDWHLLLVAKQDIAPGTELTYNYRLSGKKKKCHCRPGCPKKF
jgi:hypothetical protein